MVRARSVQSRDSGAVMPLVMLAIVISLATGVGLLTLGRTARVQAVRTATQGAASCAADAGLTKALYEMNQKLATGWSADSLPQETDQALAHCDATYSYAVMKVADLAKTPVSDADMSELLGLSGVSSGDYVVRSVGLCGQSHKTVYGILRLQGRGEYGVLVRDQISLKAGTLVDGMDSSDPTKTDVFLEIGTTSINSDKIVLNAGVVVDGDISVGPGGDPDKVIKDLGATTGAQYAMVEEPTLPPVPAPPALANKGRIEVKGETITLGPGDSGTYSRIDLRNDKAPAILEISGGEVVLHITGNVDLGQGCEIRVTQGASLSLYLDGDMHAHEEAGFTNANAPPSFKLWGKAEGSQQWDLNAKSEYVGQIYAPAAEVTVRAKSDLYGAFTAKKFEMKSGGNLYYDAALRNVNEDDEGVRFVMKRWSES